MNDVIVGTVCSLLALVIAYCYTSTVHVDASTEYNMHNLCFVLLPMGIYALMSLTPNQFGNSEAPISVETFRAKLLDKNSLEDQADAMKMKRRKALDCLAKLSNRCFTRLSDECIHIAEESVATCVGQEQNTLGTPPAADPNAHPRVKKHHAKQQEEQQANHKTESGNNESRKFVNIKENFDKVVRVLDTKTQKIRDAWWAEFCTFVTANGGYGKGNCGNAWFLPLHISLPLALSAIYIIIVECWLCICHKFGGNVPNMAVGVFLVFIASILLGTLQKYFTRQ